MGICHSESKDIVYQKFQAYIITGDLAKLQEIPPQYWDETLVDSVAHVARSRGDAETLEWLNLVI